jgi:hypothetical protein
MTKAEQVEHLYDEIVAAIDVVRELTAQLEDALAHEAAEAQPLPSLARARALSEEADRLIERRARRG